MAKPVPGQDYTVSSGDTLRTIARRAYGNDQSPLIVAANPKVLKGRPISLEGLPTIKAGDVLHIPATTSRYDGRTVTADFDTEIMVKLAGVEYRGAKAGSIKRAINTVADGFAVEIPFDYRNRALVDALRPFRYPEAQLYIGGEPYIAARAIKWSPAQSEAGTVLVIEARTKPGDLCECMAEQDAISRQNVTLLEIAGEIVKPYGLKAYSAHGDSDKFALVQKEVTDTDFEFLVKLASQKGFLVTSARDGNLLFTRAAVDAKPVAALRAGEFPVRSCGAEFDGSKRFSSWYGYADVSGLPAANAYKKDSSVPVYRPFAFSADESESTTIETAVLWRMAKSLADSTVITAEVAGWRNPDGQLWEENMKVTLWAPALCVFRESSFIVQSVELSKDDSGGDIATLGLVLPEAYNKTMPKTFPWDGYSEGAR
jgi:prophage tail gpP-like protein